MQGASLHTKYHPSNSRTKPPHVTIACKLNLPNIYHQTADEFKLQAAACKHQRRLDSGVNCLHDGGDGGNHQNFRAAFWPEKAVGYDLLLPNRVDAAGASAAVCCWTKGLPAKLGDKWKWSLQIKLQVYCFQGICTQSSPFTSNNKREY